jgi:hypothetical protein
MFSVTSQDIVSFILRLIDFVVASIIDTGTGTCRRPLNSRMDILVDTKNISVLCQFKSPHPIHMCVQLLTKIIYINVPTSHAEEMRQIALVSAVDTIV